MNDLKLKDFIKELKKSREVGLSVSEKQTLRKSFLNDVGILDEKKISLIKSPYNRWTIFLWASKSRMVFASLMIVVLLGSGVVFASEISLPGDILYPIKTNIKENVSRILNASTPQTKEKFEIKLVEKRLKEAEKLDQIKKLDEDQINEVKKGLINQTKKAEGVIKKNKEKNNNDNVSTDIDIENVDSKKTNKNPSVETGASTKTDTDENIENEDADGEETSVKKNDSEKKQKDNQGDLGEVLEKHKNIIKKLNLDKKDNN